MSSQPHDFVYCRHINALPDHGSQAFKGRLQIVNRANFAAGGKPALYPQPVNKPAAEFIGIENAVQISAPDAAVAVPRPMVFPSSPWTRGMQIIPGGKAMMYFIPDKRQSGRQVFCLHTRQCFVRKQACSNGQ